jgi:ABC-type bacteriocin/lantibiotic exporter with double-glycine peptidase domain
MNNIIGYIISSIIVITLILIAIFNIFQKRDNTNENKINIGNISLDFIKENLIVMIVMVVLVLFSLGIKVIFIPKKVSQINIQSSKMKPNNMNFFQQILKNNTIPYILLAIIIGWLIISTIQYITESISSHLDPKLTTKLTNEINKTILKSNRSQIDSGQIISRSNRLISNATQYVKKVKTIGPCVAAILVLNIYLYLVNYKLGIIMTIGSSISIFYIYYNYKNVKTLTNVESSNFHKKSEFVNDIIRNHENILLNNNQNNYLKNNDINNENYEKSQTKLLLTEKTQSFVTTVISIITVSIILYVLYNQIKNKQMKPIIFGSMVIILLLYIDWNLLLENNLPDVLVYYNKVLDSEKFLQDTLNNVNSKIIEKYRDIKKNDVSLKNVTIKIGDLVLFKNFNLYIPSNQKIGIFGKAGKGKSTLLKCIFGLIKPETGNVYIGNHINYEYNQQNFRNQVVYINQNTSLSNTTILKNLQIGNNLSRKEILDFLKKYDLMKVFKQGVDYNIILNGQNESKGMQKTIFVVRGLLRKNTKIILLDEPTTSLDESTKKNIIRAIKENTHNKTVVCVSHNNNIKKIMDKTIEL